MQREGVWKEVFEDEYLDRDPPNDEIKRTQEREEKRKPTKYRSISPGKGDASFANNHRETSERGTQITSGSFQKIESLCNSISHGYREGLEMEFAVEGCRSHKNQEQVK